MASMMQILIGATNNTGPAFAGARANVASLGAATTQTSSQINTLGVASGVASARAQMLSDRIQFQQRSLSLLSTQISQTTGRYGLMATQTQAQILRFDRLTDSIRRNEQELRRLQNQAARGGGTPVLPRSFAGFTGQGLMQGAGALGIATGIPEVIGQFRQLANEGQTTQVSLDSTRASLGALMGDQERANQIFDRAVAIGQRYGFTQRQTAEALQASSLLIRDSTSSIEDTISVLTRLSTLNPAEGVSGASFAIAELASGDIVSLNERFRIGRDVAREWRDEIRRGEDPIAVLNRGLEKMGVGAEVIRALQTGAAGQQREWNQAIEDLGLTINNVVTSTGWRQFATGLVKDTSAEITYLQNLGAAIDELGQKASQDRLIMGLARIEDAASTALQRQMDDYQAQIEGWLGMTGWRTRAGTEMRGERDIPQAPTATAPSQTTFDRPARFAGFGVGNAPFVPPPQQYRDQLGFSSRVPERTGPTVVIHNHIAGSVVTEREIGEISHKYLVMTARQNAGSLDWDR